MDEPSVMPPKNVLVVRPNSIQQGITLTIKTSGSTFGIVLCSCVVAFEPLLEALSALC